MPGTSFRLLAFARRRLLVCEGEGGPTIALVEETALGGAISHFPLGPAHPGVRIADLAEDAAAPAGTELREIRPLLATLPAEEVRLAVRALHVLEWARTHRFCGRCGTANEEKAPELARQCPACGLVTFPRISPAVIVLVRRGDRVLLGRGNHLPPGLFSTLAGFVEPGETLEETVRREIREEAGIEVDRVRYFGSQPWPFPDSLMIGFTAEHAAGEIVVDHDELAEARWFGLDELPPVPPPFSIARSLIDAWVRDRGGDLSRVVTWSR